MPQSLKCQFEARSDNRVTTSKEKETETVDRSSHEENVDNQGEGHRAMSLPLELVTLILESLDSQDAREVDFRSLQTLALVSRIWCRAAQAKLFCTIRIDCRASCQFWSRKFKHSPHLGEYVRFLYLSDPGDDCMGTPYLRTSPARFLVSALTRLQGLTVRNTIRWGPVEQRLVKGFRSVTVLAVLDGVGGMKGCRDIPDLFYALPNVHTLRLATPNPFKDFSPQYEAGVALQQRIPENGKPRQLRELQLIGADFSVEYFMWLTGPSFDLSTLTRLSLSWQKYRSWVGNGIYKPNFSCLDQFCRLTGRSVARLELPIPTRSYYRQDWLTSKLTSRDPLTVHLRRSRILASFTALRTISISPGDDYYDGSLPFLISSSVSLLGTLATPHRNLCRIILTAKLDVTLNIHDYQRIWGISQWKDLDELLSGDSFPTLSRVDLVVHIGCGRRRRVDISTMAPDQEPLLQDIRACLPRAVSKGVPEIEIQLYRAQSPESGSE
ncbi:hypothetical protein Moror_11418 [Moniliophthora roreri MCA 2997]|uniref:F-box domain-containing protein n=2 Tax=Moniliophthora roreri TaxID=221103 RepID=V2WBH6_MONRO|nr:hypothetical protein Moror_11418 [Moniliophthora roreri MCA 2997]KAI3619951.1 hypothetical protein WG66_002657 [Moniliophthora roreri]